MLTPIRRSFSRVGTLSKTSNYISLYIRASPLKRPVNENAFSDVLPRGTGSPLSACDTLLWVDLLAQAISTITQGSTDFNTLLEQLRLAHLENSDCNLMELIAIDYALEIAVREINVSFLVLTSNTSPTTNTESMRHVGQ